MQNHTLMLAGLGAAFLLGLSPAGAVLAQTDAVTPAAVAHGDWTLRQREDWLTSQLEKARADGSLTKASFNRARLEMRNLANEESRMRHDAHGQLTDHQTAELDARLDTVATKIDWANMSAHTRPW
jgi:hypothetical protein